MPMCRQCSGSFVITAEEVRQREALSPMFAGKTYVIPAPDSCPDCRMRERYIWRPELHLFKRKSDLSGQMMLSKYPPEARCTVYSHEEWWSDAWDPFSYGKNFNFNRPFLEQFSELIETVPLIALSVSGNENSDYVNSVSWCRNCYLLAGANHDEDCYFGNFVNYCSDCMDCNFIDHCQLCYECIDCAKCYNLRYSQNCSNCSDSAFLYGCRGCKHCFGSVNLSEKEYVFLNEQLHKDEYEKRLADVGLASRKQVADARRFFEKHRLKFPHKSMIGEMNEDVTGNAIHRSRRVYDSFDVSDSEDCRYCSWFHQAKNCMDCYSWGFPAEECYACMEVGRDCHNVLFSCVTYNGSNLTYCYNCREGCSDLFGCVSMKRGHDCIFNKQYSKEDYEKLAARIVEHMQKTGEWGQFFPMSISPLAYNQTIAQDYFPLSKEAAQKLGAKWNDEPMLKAGSVTSVPDSIDETASNVCDEVLTCEATGKSYKIIPQEWKFYETHRIPVPAICFQERHERRLKRRNPRKLWDRNCMKCSKAIRTSFAPDRPETVYCEDCYLKEVY